MAESAAPDWDAIVVELKDFVEQGQKLKEQLKEERERRELNLTAQPLTEEELVRCDSSFKKNNGLIRKLKSIALKEKDTLCAEIRKVNQTKYVSEVVTAIAESQIKAKDMPAAVEICSLLHQRYGDFTPGLKESLTKNYLLRVPGEETKSIVARRRSCVRLAVELHLAGLFDGQHFIQRIIKELTNSDYEKDAEMCAANIMLLTSFAKVGRTQLLHLPRQPSLSLLKFQEPTEESPENVQEAWRAAQAVDQELQLEIGLGFAASETDASALLAASKAAAERWFETVLAEHKKLRELENENTRVLNAKGELPEAQATDYENKRKAFDHLHSIVMAYGESLDMTMPELPQDKMARIAGGVVQLVDVSDDKETHPLYEDAETREFYEILPDLRSTVPPVLLGLTEDKDATPATPTEAQESESDAAKGSKGEKEGDEGESHKDARQAPSTAHKKLDGLVQRLHNCYTRDLADEIATDFCYMNNKSTRKRLTRALCDVPKGCLPLIPFFARIAANLNQVFPDIATGIVTHLEQEFNAFLAKKDPTTYTLEARITNMRYMGELCKFKLINYGMVFTCLKKLLDDFAHVNIDAACALIETAGSYLTRLPETQGRMENRLEQMNRLKNAKNLDSRHRALIDNAYFQCKPPKSGVRRKRRPPIHEYIRHLIFSELSESNFREVFKKMRKVTWEEHEAFVVHCLLKATVKLYSQVPLVASLCSGLTKYNDSLAVGVVDSVLEEIQLGMENPAVGLYQHRMAHVRFLGELYNYRLIDSKTLFDTLYWILSFGRTSAEELNKLDPPGDAFRIKMVCTILETCGRYFSKGTARKRMDRFLVYFQRYILSKPALSMDIEFELSDLFEKLRPDMHRFDTFEEANASVEVIEAEIAAQEGRSGSDEDGEDEESFDDSDDPENQVEAVDLDDDDDAIDRGAKPAAPEFDLEFEQTLQALLQEHQRLTPAQIKPVEDVKENADGHFEKMPFKVLLKKGGKDDMSRRLDVPLTVTMAQRQKEHDNQEAEDLAIIKARVLAAQDKEEEQERLGAEFNIRNSRVYRGRSGGNVSFSYGGRRYRRR